MDIPPMDEQRADRQRRVALMQAAYYVPTGVWPLVGMRSFEWLTGRKTDRWLVQTVGLLVGVVGAMVGLAGERRRVTPEMEGVAVGTALSLAAIDVVFVARRRIRPVYLLDAGANLGIAAGWLRARR